MTWNYRVIHHEECGEHCYDIREVYYEESRPATVAVDSCFPFGTSPENLAKDLAMMAMAIGKPVLELEDF
jgi:hypothetical protein